MKKVIATALLVAFFIGGCKIKNEPVDKLTITEETYVNIYESLRQDIHGEANLHNILEFIDQGNKDTTSAYKALLDEFYKSQGVSFKERKEYINFLAEKSDSLDKVITKKFDIPTLLYPLTRSNEHR